MQYEQKTMTSILDAVPLILDSSFLSLSEVSCLCQVSKDMQLMIQQEETCFWKQKFEEIVEVGASYYKNSGDYIEEEQDVVMRNISRRSRRMNPVFYKVDPSHNGLLPCFSTNVDPSVIERVGYYQMVKCLMSKTCCVCGEMGNFASPHSFRRYCRQGCADCDEGSSPDVLDETNTTKESDYMPEDQRCTTEISNISGSMPTIESTSLRNSFFDNKKTTLSLKVMAGTSSTIEDIDKRIKDEKSEITTVSNNGLIKCDNNDGVDDEDKYNLKRLQDQIETGPHQQCLPVGVYTLVNTRYVLPNKPIGFTHALKCNSKDCHVSGCLSDIVRHERLQHNEMYAHPQNHNFEVIYPEVQSIKYMNTSFSKKFAKYRKKLSRLVKQGLVKKSMGISTTKMNGKAFIVNNWSICFCNGCKLAIDLRSSLCNSEEKERYDIDILFQSNNNHIPLQLLFLSFDGQNNDNHEEIINDKALVFVRERIDLESELELIELLSVLIETSINRYTLERFSQIYLKVGQRCKGHHQNNILTKIFQRIYCTDVNHNDSDWNEVQWTSMNLRSYRLRKNFFKLQRSLNMYHVKRLVRRRSIY